MAKKIDYNGLGALRGQLHIPSKHKPKYPPASRDAEGSSVQEKSQLARVEKARVLQPRPQGFSLKKMGGAGKGPGIGWSRVQPKYS